MLRRRGGDLSGGQQQQLAIGRALAMRPKLLMLDEPTEGIQPSIIKDIGRAIAYLRQRGDMAILLVEQYLDFAHELADDFAVMERGEIVMAGTRESFDADAVRRHMTVYPSARQGEPCGRPRSRHDATRPAFAGQLVVLHGLDAGLEGVAVARGALDQAAAAGRQVVDHLGPLERQRVEVDDVDVGLVARRQQAAVGRP